MNSIPTNKYISFGNSIHKTLADYNLINKHELRSLQQLHNLFRKNWIREGYDSLSEEREFGLRGLELLSTYFHQPQDDGLKNLIVEEMLYKETDTFILCGKLDKAYERRDHVIEVLDYKTGNLISPMGHIQLPLYLLLAEANLGVTPGAASLYHLPENRKITKEMSSEQIANFKKYIYRLCERICNEKNFAPNPSHHCIRECEYFNICFDDNI